MAAIWDEWITPKNEVLRSCSIVTTRSNGLVGRIHERMPVIVRPIYYENWINSGSLDQMVASTIFEPFPANRMGMREVNRNLDAASHKEKDPAPLKNGNLFGETPLI